MASDFRRLISSLLLLCLRITLGYSCTGEARGDRGQGGLDDAVRGVNLMQHNACNHSEVPSNSFKIVHRFGPCSPSKNNVTPPDINDEILRQDMLRVAYLQRRFRSGSVSRRETVDPRQGLVQTTIPVRSGHTIGSFLYVIIVGLGMPRRMQTVDFDTGSSFSWIQCRPCQPCKRQQDPLFDPTLSSSYRKVPCNDLACTSLPHNIGGCTNNTCTYNITYTDSDSSRGIVSRERLWLPAFAVNQFPNFVFGCGHQNIVRDQGTAGLFGLGRGLHSLVTQTSSRFGLSFSYCLPSSVAYQGYLTLGHSEDASRTTYTPILRYPHIDPNFYFINLTAISINNKRLQMPSWVFERGGTIIDSGAVVTHLPRDLYIQVREAFRQGMSQYHYQLAPAYKNLDTCYNINIPSFPYPSITFHFDRRANLTLGFAQVFYPVDWQTYCLAFSQMGQGDVYVLGSRQQLGIEVIYDLKKNRFGFYRRPNCR